MKTEEGVMRVALRQRVVALKEELDTFDEAAVACLPPQEQRLLLVMRSAIIHYLSETKDGQ